ncbi:dynein regulation protein LC7 [Ignicoccus pacificus DSM 13166]|uniref:Dynein regulation protein LC7 n=1 Tax=Ignicoccus pacificus DSM 13166 TaxID=940294 RepID=A0A977PKT1_9CREN|nr:dynein regulation protein LC7 [Ignicoccus pacificus DSM 13166]
MSVESPLRRILNEMVRVEGVNAALVISKDGFAIDFVVSGGAEIDPESIAAMLVTIHGAVKRFGEEFNLGKVELVTAEYEKGKVLLADIEDAIVVLITEKDALLGRVRFELKRQKDRIQAALGT